MNKNIIMIVGALGLVLVIIFWVQYNIVKSLQANSATVLEGTSGTAASPIHSSSSTPGSTSTAPSASQPATGTKKTKISAPVHKH